MTEGAPQKRWYVASGIVSVLVEAADSELARKAAEELYGMDVRGLPAQVLTPKDADLWLPGVLSRTR